MDIGIMNILTIWLLQLHDFSSDKGSLITLKVKCFEMIWFTGRFAT